MKQKLLIILLSLLSFSFSSGQTTEPNPEWNKPVEPFKIIGNIYYVGASDVTSFLITTPKGHILIDSGFAETVPQIQENIKKLSFKIEDVKILLNSHAHYDHAGGLAELKRLTKAKLYASPADKILLENGGKGDFHFGDKIPYEAVEVDKTLKDKQIIKLGTTSLTAIFTPGHTKGCTSWLMKVREKRKIYTVIFVGSTSIPGYKLVGNANYPNIAADYEKTFRELRAIKADVFLASHGVFFDLPEKAEKLRKKPLTNPFLDYKGYIEFLDITERAFRGQLESEKERIQSASTN